jgi:hypothetical protein
MTSIALPQELFNVVIRYLHCNYASSGACALVCRSWLHPARQNLFNSVDLQFNEWILKDFLELLEDSPELASYIRRVNWLLPPSNTQCPPESEIAVSVLTCLATLSNDYGTTHSITINMRRDHDKYLLSFLSHAPAIVSYVTGIRFGYGDGWGQWESSAARSLASQLRSIKTLTLSDWGFYYWRSPPLPLIAIGPLFNPTSITTLKLENIVFTDGSHLLHLVQAFTALEDLSYDNIQWPQNTVDILSRGSPKAPPLRRIVLESSHPTVSLGFVRWLLDQPITPRLATINVSGTVPSELNELIPLCASSIINLILKGEQVIDVHSYARITLCSLARQIASSRLI